MALPFACYTSGMRRLAVLAAVGLVVVTVLSPAAASGLTWSDLRNETGVVVLMRHALAPGGGDPPGFQLGRCETQRNLSSQGREQAQNIGARVRASGVEIAGVLSSPWCRSADTARLLGLGPVRTRMYLGSTFTAPRSVVMARKERLRQVIASHRGADGVLVVVAHYANIRDLIGSSTTSGEAVAVRMDGSGGLEVLGSLR